MRFTQFLYRCRQCGTTYRPNGVGGNGLNQLTEAITLPRTSAAAVDLYSLHMCGNGRTGVSDLIGAETDDEPA